jgi:teichuronic acid biosynthesis glycosyltransferase TuaG
MPLVSVITPVFNAAKWLPDTLQSVRNQTIVDWEHLLVDDGSSDESCRVIENAAKVDSRIRLLKTPQNGGPAKARNLGIKASTGRYLAFLDADDLWLEHKLARTVNFIRQSECAFAYHAFRYISADGSSTGALVLGPDQLNFRALHTRRGTGDCMSMVIDRKVVKDFLFPELPGRLHEDWAAWLSLVRRGYAGRLLAEDLGRYRLSPGSRNATKLTSARRVWHLYRSIEGLPWLRAANWWTQYAWNSFWLRRKARPDRGPATRRALLVEQDHRRDPRHETQLHVAKNVLAQHE